MTKDEYLQVIRSLIDRETSLQNHRLMWFLASQSLLATACGVFWDKSPCAVAIVVLLGLSSAVASFVGLRLCTLAIKFYRSKVMGKIDEKTDPPVDYDYETADRKSWWLLFLLPWKFLPWAFFVGWVALGVVKLVRL